MTLMCWQVGIKLHKKHTKTQLKFNSIHALAFSPQLCVMSKLHVRSRLMDILLDYDELCTSIYICIRRFLSNGYMGIGQTPKLQT